MVIWNRGMVCAWIWLFEFLLQEYKPYMFWMNMIDAFYQSLICFFIPYFVSLIKMFWAFAEISMQNPWLFKYVFLKLEAIWSWWNLFSTVFKVWVHCRNVWKNLQISETYFKQDFVALRLICIDCVFNISVFCLLHWQIFSL